MKTRQIIASIIEILLMLMFGAFSLFLTWAAFFYTNRYPLDYVEGYIDIYHDSVPVNIAIVVVVLVLGVLINWVLSKSGAKTAGFTHRNNNNGAAFSHPGAEPPEAKSDISTPAAEASEANSNILSQGSDSSKINTGKNKSELIVHIIAAVLSVLILIGLIVFIRVTQVEPIYDQLQLVINAALFKRGIYEDMNGYMNTFQQQYGLVFLYEMAMHVFPESFKVFQYMNAVLAAGSIYASYHVAKHLFRRPGISLLTVLGSACFIPLYFYVNFVYGEIPSIGFAMFGLWMLLKFLDDTGSFRQRNRLSKPFLSRASDSDKQNAGPDSETDKVVSKQLFTWKMIKSGLTLLAALLLLSLAYLARTNLIILMIALFLSLILYGIRYKKRIAYIVAPFVLLCPLLLNAGVRKSYELRSGYTIGAAQPALGWIVMGMQISDRGYGFCNDYANDIFASIAESDPEKAKAIYKEDFDYLLGEFLSEPKTAATFYKVKLMQQWNEGTFGSIVHTHTFPEGIPNEFTARLYCEYYGKYISAFCNRYLSVVYLGFFAYAVLRIIMLTASLIALFRADKHTDYEDSTETTSKKFSENATETIAGGNAGSGFETVSGSVSEPVAGSATGSAAGSQSDRTPLLSALCRADEKSLSWLLAVYFIGGFLFSILWEAKPRYVFPYVYFCIPLVAATVYQIYDFLFTLLKNKNNREE